MEGKRGRPRKEVEPKMTEESIESEKQKLMNRLRQLEEEERQEQERIDMINQKAQEEAKERADFEEWKRHKESVKRLVNERYPALADKYSNEDIDVLEDESDLEDNPLEKKVRAYNQTESKEAKTFWGKFFKKEKVKKEGKVAVMLLHKTTDATVDYIDVEQDGSFEVLGEQYHINEHCLYNLKFKKDRYPLCILPTWTMIPIGTKAWFELSQERRGHELERIILNAIKKEEAIKMDDGKKKNKMSAKTIWIILAVVVGGYIFLKSRGG